MIGSLVETNLSDELYNGGQSDIISDTTGASMVGREKNGIPLTEVHHESKHERASRRGVQRKQLIETLVNFSSHVPTSVLDDLLAHETNLDDALLDSELESSSTNDGSLSSLSSGGHPEANLKDEESSTMERMKLSQINRIIL